MWLQPDEVSCLKTLINTIISTFTDVQEFSLGCLFCLKIKSSPPNSPHHFLDYEMQYLQQSDLQYLLCLHKS